MSAPRRVVDRSYLLGAALGEGGMGAVYRATHLLNHQVVALKLVTQTQAQQAHGGGNGHGADQPSAEVELRMALAREFQTLASLHHPNVIRVQSYGFDEDLGSYFTMEILNNCRTIVDAGGGRSLADNVSLLAQLLRALSYIHRRGVIHRDLKPSNVLVVQDEVKLLDFGVSVGEGHVADLAGTLGYMAPELLAGGVPSVASDLYAVGLILHQLLTGQLPDVDRGATVPLLGGPEPSGLGAVPGVTPGDAPPTLPVEPLAAPDAVAATAPVLGAPPAPFDVGNHPTERVVRVGDDAEPAEPAPPAPALAVLAEPSRFSLTSAFARLDALDSLDGAAAPGPELSVLVPGALGDVLRKMLRRDPTERYPDADAALQALAAAVGVDIPVETSETRESFLRATMLVGRESELAALRESIDRLKAGGGDTLLIGGESGVGKSRLLAELRTLALVYGCWVAEGQAVTEGGTYYQEFLPLLRAIGLRVDLTDEEAAVLKPLVPDIGELIGRDIPEAPPIKPEELQARLATTLRGLLARLQKPVLVILEDLHWARAESIALLAELSKAKNLPVLLIATYRSDECPDLPERLPAATLLPLRRLGPDEIARLSESMLGAIGHKPELVEYLARQTEGNVFFLVEVVRALAENAGELRRIGEGELPDSVLTTGIGRIVERRLDHIDPAYRPALEFAATLGRKLDLAVLQHAFPELPLRSLLLTCANAAVLESQGSDWRFSHDKLREAILRRIPSPRRAVLHGEVAEAMEASYSGEERERASAQLAFHFALAERPERALTYYDLAGDRAARLGLLAESRGHYRDALLALARLPDDLPRRRQHVDLLLKLMKNSLVHDPLQTQLERVSEAQALLDSLTTEGDRPREDKLRQVRLDYYTGRAYYYVGQTAEAIRRYQRVLPLAQEFGDAELTAMPAAVTGMALIVQTHIGKSHAMLTRALGPLRQLGSEFEVVRCQQYIGLAQAFMGQYREGLALLEEAEALAQKMNQPQLLIIAKLFRTIAYRAGMSWERMLESVQPICVTVDKLGEKAYGAVAWSLAAWAHAHLGQPAEAKEARARALGLARELGGKYLGTDWFLASDAEAAILAGRPDDALTIARGVAESSRAANLPLSWGIAERSWGAALSRLGGDPAEVDAHMEESIRALTVGDLGLDVAQTRISWAECCQLRGDEAAARRHLEAARAAFATGGCVAAVASVEERLRSLSRGP